MSFDYFLILTKALQMTLFVANMQNDSPSSVFNKALTYLKLISLKKNYIAQIIDTCIRLGTL